MATYDFRILIETTKGKQFSYYSSSYFNSSNTVDGNTYALSSSEAWHRITGSTSCSYQNSTQFTGDYSASAKFSDNIYLSSSPHSTITTNYDEALWNGVDWVSATGVSSLPGVVFLPLLLNLPEMKDSYDFKSQKWQTQTSRIEISNIIYISSIFIIFYFIL